MTRRLIKTRKDHAQLRALLDENTKGDTLTLTPAAGALTAGVVGTPYPGVTFASSDAVGSPVFTVAAGELPPGLSLNSLTGALSGTPTEEASATFSVRVTDGMGNTKTQAYTLAVTES